MSVFRAVLLSRRQILAAFAAWPGAALAGELIERSPRPQNYETPVEVFVDRITPTSSFYIRSHFDAPTVSPETWRLKVAGTGRLSVSLADLAQLPQTTVEAVLQCAGNGRGLIRPRVAGVQWARGAMGNATWTGVKLSHLLRAAEIAPGSAHVIVSGADRPLLPATPAFVRSIPLERALHPSTLIATQMNGEPLTTAHGFPARLVVPGWVGDDWVKWIDDVVISPTEAKGFFYEKGYRFPDPPGEPGAPVPPERMFTMTRLNVKSVIARPGRGEVLPAGTHRVIGVAFSGDATIKRVDISTDRGAWRPAKLAAATSPYGWQVFEEEVTLKKPGRVRIFSRATDTLGAVQPAQAVWNPSGYLYNAIDEVEVEVRG